MVKVEVGELGLTETQYRDGGTAAGKRGRWDAVALQTSPEIDCLPCREPTLWAVTASSSSLQAVNAKLSTHSAKMGFLTPSRLAKVAVHFKDYKCSALYP